MPDQKMDLKDRKQMIKALGNACGNVAHQMKEKDPGAPQWIADATAENPWFTSASIRLALEAWREALREEKVDAWADMYKGNLNATPAGKTIGLVNAGNIPMVGLHDLLCCILTGDQALVKLSSEDARLIPGLVGMACEEIPALEQQVRFTQGTLKGFDAVIATGSNNTARYFDYYFGKYPHIIRKTRNGAAVLSGREGAEEISALGDDMFRYFGLGCRNVSKLYLPAGMDPVMIFPHLEGYGDIIHHHKYGNNYEYQKAILMINSIPFHDNGFLLLRQETALASPVSVVHYEYYDRLEDVNKTLRAQADQLQCVMANRALGIEGALPFGSSQTPELWDYADDVDTVQFLTMAC